MPNHMKFSYNVNNNGKHKLNHLTLPNNVEKARPVLSPIARKAAGAKLKNSPPWTVAATSFTSPNRRRLTSSSGADEPARRPVEQLRSVMDGSDPRSPIQRVSYRKAIQRAGCNMNELDGTGADGAVAATAMRKEYPILEHIDWTDNAIPDHHVWAGTSASGDLCYVGEEHCRKSGPRKRCSACHIVVHENCFDQFKKIAFPCKTTFREFTSKSMRESLVVHHHWVHRRKLDGKCKQCGKSFEKRFGFREPTKIIAISCSWCKEAYHNKVQCFQLQKINEPCTLGSLSKSIVPPTWIIKPPKQKSIRSRSKKRRSSLGAPRKRSSKESRNRTFVVRPLSQQAAFVSPILVFINPKSGGRQGPKLLQSFRWLMNPRQVFDLSKEGPREPLELYRKVPNLRILACGGDGTVGWILSVLDNLGVVRSPPVAVLPLGTGNDLSRTLNFGHGYTDEPLHKIIQGVEEARMVKLDRWKLFVEKNEDAVLLNDEEENSSSMGSEYPTGGAGVDQLPIDVVNNYFSIGSDAQVALSFHESREAHPSKFTSRFGNKFFYARASVLEYLTRQSKDLSKHITVECDGEDITPKLRELKPVCLLFLNIPRYSSGTTPWGNPTASDFKAQCHNDKLIEVLAFSLNQLGMLFVGGHGERLRQCSTAVIRTSKAFPVQVDGEPCKLNPSNIKLEFFNQANMLAKTKRRISATQEFSQPSHEQIKIRVSVVHHQNFKLSTGAKEPLCVNATPLLVTVVMNQSTLNTVRSCLSQTINEMEKPSNLLAERWFFLDGSDPDKFSKIDKNRESHLIVSDVITSDREVYILDMPEESQPGKNQHAKTSTWRKRIQSDSSVLLSSSSAGTSFSSLTQATPSISEEVKVIGGGDGNAPDSSVPPSAALDIVFELPESGDRTTSAPCGATSSKFSFQFSADPVHEEPISSATPQNPTFSSPVFSHLPMDSDCSSSRSTSSNEYVLTDNSSIPSPSRSGKDPLHISYSPSAVDYSLPPVFTSQMSLEEMPIRKVKTHKRSKTDTDARKAAGLYLSPGQILNTMLRSKNQNNNNVDEKQPGMKNSAALDHRLDAGTNGIYTTNSNGDQLSEWNRIFLDASKRGDLDQVKQALKHGARLDARDQEGCTALHLAARFSRDAVVDHLIAIGDRNFLDALCSDRRQTALHKAAWYGRVAMCEKLLNAGASTAIKDYKGLKPLDKAKQANSNELVDLFEHFQVALDDEDTHF